MAYCFVVLLLLFQIQNHLLYQAYRRQMLYLEEVN